MGDNNNVEKLLKAHKFDDNNGDFNNVWNKYNANRTEEVPMSEKKGGLKVVLWLVSFMVIAGLGFFGLTKYSEMQKHEKLTKGESILVTLVVGKVEVKKMGATDWRDLYVEDVLAMGDNIKTAALSYCEIQMVKRGIFRVGADSDLQLAKLVNIEGKVDSRMRLNKGQIAVMPKKLKSGETFEVETSTAVAAVRGTKFIVKADEDGNTKIAVDEGKVAVSPNITSIKKAQENGLITEKAAKVLQEQVVKPVEVVPGEELDMDKTQCEVIDGCIGHAVEELAKAGELTDEKLLATPADETEPATVKSDVMDEIVAKTKENIAIVVEEKIEEAKKSGADSEKLIALKNVKKMATSKGLDTAVVSKKAEISEESKQALEKVSEDKIINDVLEMVKIKIKSDPVGADVYFDDEKVGATPFNKTVAKGTKFSVKLTMEGYKEFSKGYIADTTEISINKSLSKISAVEETPAEVAADTTEETATDGEEPVEVKKMPGDLVWNKSLSFVSQLKNNSVVYRDRIAATVGDTLYILSLNGKVITKTVVAAGAKLTAPTAGNGMFYIGSSKGGIYAYTLNGAKAWSSQSAGASMYGGSPAARSGLVAAPSMTKGVKLFSSGGASKGGISVSAQIFSAPLIVAKGSIVVYATEKGDLVGYSVAEGKELWKKASVVGRVVFPLMGNDSIVCVFDRSTGALIGFDPKTGEQKWKKDIPGAAKPAYAPAYMGGFIFIVNNAKSKLYVVYSGNGGIVLAKNYGNITSPAYYNAKTRTVYIGANGKLNAYSFKTRSGWTGGNIVGSVVAVGGNSEGAYAVTASKMYRYINK